VSEQRDETGYTADGAADDLVTLTKVRNEFEAGIIVATLKEEGIEAVAFGAFRNFLPVDTRFTGVPIQVRKSDLERAREALAEAGEMPADVDWGEIDVGEREDQLPLREPGRMPWPARIALVVAILAALTLFAGFVVMLIV
jgi:hypothetical protein